MTFLCRIPIWRFLYGPNCIWKGPRLLGRVYFFWICQGSAGVRFSYQHTIKYWPNRAGDGGSLDPSDKGKL